MAKPDEQLAECREIFCYFDSKGDEKINVKQVGDVLRALGQNPTEAEIRKCCEHWTDPETRISFEEFVPIYQTVSKNQNQYNKEQFVEGLSHFDKEGNGTIAVSELKHLLTTLGEKLTDEEVEQLLAGHDVSNGFVNIESFVDAVIHRGIAALGQFQAGPWHHLMGAELSAQQQQKLVTKTGKSGTAVGTAGHLLIRWPVRTKLLPAGQKTKPKQFHSTVTVENSNTDVALKHQQKCPQQLSTANGRSMHRQPAAVGFPSRSFAALQPSILRLIGIPSTACAVPAAALPWPQPPTQRRVAVASQRNNNNFWPLQNHQIRPSPVTTRTTNSASVGQCMKNLLERLWDSRRRRRPFRGFRRAATSTGSPISCCSSACSAAGSISIPAFPRTHSTVMVIPGARSAVPSSAAGSTGFSPSSTSGFTPGSTPRALGPPDEEDPNNNNINEQLLLHFPRLPPGISNNNEGEPMVVATISSEKQSLVTQYGFQTHRPRPPLNRAIPPIPESRSNESIQSNQSGVRRQSSGLQQQTVRIIDENNPIDEMGEVEARSRPDSILELEQKGSVTSVNVSNNKGTKASRLPKFIRRKEKAQKEVLSNEQRQPKSPLLSVAHTVRNRFSRFTGSKTAKSASELPLSRSLEISGSGSSKIPQKAEPMPKSRSMEEQREAPRRMPVTTLIPSPSMGPRRLPPDEEFEESKQQKDFIKQVQFAPLPFDDEKPQELRRQPELPFCIWTPEKIVLIDEQEERKKTDADVTVIETIQYAEVPPPTVPLPASETESPPSSTGQRSPPKVLPLLRKSPQSFPPLGSLNIAHKEDSVRPSKSAMSVSFGAADIKAKEEKEEHKEGKRKVFTTRSLRMVATRVCEASPLVKRRGRSASRERTEPQKIESFTIGSAKLFRRKSNSIPEDGGQQNLPFKGNRSFTEGKSQSKVKLRSAQSVRTVQSLRAQAPLAETESSRIENSPAVEQCPPWEAPGTAKAGDGLKTNVRRSFLFGVGANARLCRKDKEEQERTLVKKEEMGKPKNKALPLTIQSSSRPTLAQLLASPLPRKKTTHPIESSVKKDKGLIDDEIKDQPMLLGNDFRLIDEPGSSCIHSASVSKPAPPPSTTLPNSNSPDSSAPSSVLLVAEQQPTTGEVNIQMVQQKMHTTLSLAEQQKGRKRNARADSESSKEKAAPNSSSTPKIKSGKVAAAKPGTSTAENKNKTASESDTKEEEMPWADESVKSEDGASLVPVAILGDFRSDLCQLRNIVRQDLEELETLRLQNAILREQLAERDRIIGQLQRQLRGEI